MHVQQSMSTASSRTLRRYRTAARSLDPVPETEGLPFPVHFPLISRSFPLISAHFPLTNPTEQCMLARTRRTSHLDE